MSKETKSESELRDKLSHILKGNYACGRTWEAWQVGTMSESDFTPLEEDEYIINDLLELISAQRQKDREKVLEIIGGMMQHISGGSGDVLISKKYLEQAINNQFNYR